MTVPERVSCLLSIEMLLTGRCGEVCHKDYCRVCSDKRDSRVDLLEVKTYGEIDLDGIPIVILGAATSLPRKLLTAIW